MDKIILLSPEISQKIAAGEVIERPSSAVKELVENSLDAQASDIKVEILEGGKRLIHVMDNGCGMSHEDALICFKRYSTSKLKEEDDLNRISTLGFRGEALPSISAVSRITLKTSEGGEDKGTLIKRKGDEVLCVSDIAFPHGTSIEVEDLFFNLPARKKFLRTERAELSQVIKILIFICLAFHDTGFSLKHGARVVFNYPPVKTLKERIYQVYGRSVLDTLMEIDYGEEGKRLYGYVSRPAQGRRDRSHQLFFVNRRPVKDKTLLAALNRAFIRFLEKDYYAEAFLFLSCPLSDVDVNVHPAKAEVRFNDSSFMFHLVHMSIEQALLKNAGVKEVYLFQKDKKPNSRIAEDKYFPVFRDAKKETHGTKDLFFPQVKEERSYPRILGQYLNIYIIAVDQQGIFIIDQHNAHEKVLFEAYQEIDKKKKWPRKLALLPLLVELSPSQILSFEQNKVLLEEAGFRVEAMGSYSFAVREYPDMFKEQEAKDILLSLLAELDKEKIEGKKKKLLATMACKTAIKAGEPLSYEKMNYLVEELFKTSNPSICPHGRPIIIKIDRSEIEKNIGRN